MRMFGHAGAGPKRALPRPFRTFQHGELDSNATLGCDSGNGVGLCGVYQGTRTARQPFPSPARSRSMGQACRELAVTCHDTKGIDKADPTVSAAFTDEEGNFKISTFEAGDGVPVGDYVLTFAWGKMNLLTMQYSGDKFNGKYADPKTSTHKFTVKEGVPTDLGTIELTTK